MALSPAPVMAVAVQRYQPLPTEAIDIDPFVKFPAVARPYVDPAPVKSYPAIILFPDDPPLNQSVSLLRSAALAKRLLCNR